MKRYIITVFFGWCIIYAFSQNQYVALPVTYETSGMRIDSVMNQYTNNNDYNRALIYSPLAELSSVCFILIIDFQDSIKYWAFRDSTIIKEGFLPDKAIFNYKDYKKTGVIKREDPPVNFIPPLMCQYSNSEWVMYKSHCIEFYFEYGAVVTYYAEDSGRVKYRKEWLDIIRMSLKDIIFDKSN